MANLGDTYKQSLNDEPLFCTYDNNGITRYFLKREMAECFLSDENLNTIVWVNGENNPNTKVERVLFNSDRKFKKEYTYRDALENMAEWTMFKGRAYKHNGGMVGYNIY